MDKNMDNKAIVKRLKRIEGQVRGIINMVEQDRPCEEILMQIGSAKQALHKAGQLILEGHLRHCVVDGIKAGKENETMKSLTKALEQFSRIG